MFRGHTSDSAFLEIYVKFTMEQVAYTEIIFAGLLGNWPLKGLLITLRWAKTN